MPEVSRGHSRPIDPAEGPNEQSWRRARISMSERDATKRVEIPERAAGGGGRKPPWTAASASNTPARRGNLPPKVTDLMRAVVEREIELVSLRNVSMELRHE
jgi:hypothetical protein